MTPKIFLDFVEIRTKVASVLPFLVAAGYVLLESGRLKGAETALFFISMFCIDLATTAINNYMDKYKGLSGGLAAIFLLLSVSAASGLVLVFLAGWPVLLMGMAAFAVGITYTFGPKPIYATPFGELASGTMMGGLIVVAFYYIQTDAAALAGIAKAAAISLPLVFTIAGIMLANNICDLEEDRASGRRTLPVHVGIPRSLKIFTGLYAGSYLAIILCAAAGILPWAALAVLLTMVPVWHNIRIFNAHQDKRRTFPVSVQNFLLIAGTYAVSLHGAFLLERLLS